MMPTANTYQPQKNLYFLILFFLLLICPVQFTAGQSVTSARQDFEKLNKAYHAGNISDDKYLDQAYSLTQQFLDNGIEFKTQELANILRLYQEIAWSKKEYGRPRVNYYLALANNALMFGETGAAMYYTEKESRELEKNGRIRPLLEDQSKVQILTEQESYGKVISLYKGKEAYIKQLPELLRDKKADNVNGMHAIDILMGTINSYLNMHDTTAACQTIQVADQISAELKRKYPINRTFMFYNDYFILMRQYDIAAIEGRQAKAGALLDSIQALKSTYEDQATSYIERTLYELKIEHFLALKKNDSVHFYISKLASLPVFLKNQQPIVDEYKAKLQAAQGDYHGGYTWLAQSLANERKAKTILMTQMDSLLYAYTDAENTRVELQHSEAVKKQRTLWLVVISSAAALIVLAIYFIMLYRSRKAKAQIEALNNATNMQIISMEEAKHEAVREVQRRLGQDLHDGLSSSIAAIRHQLETLSMDTEDINLKNKLSRLQLATTNAYEAARRKSHEWFNAADGQQELSFEKQVRLLTDDALPNGRYSKTIHIDDNSLINVDTDTRIALLRIVQEAITNIIKHARAKNVSILVYEEEDDLILTISDDGIGLNAKKSGSAKSAIGLDSIRRRVEYLNGETNINSSAEGTELIVSIPLVSSYTGAH
ncbi:sensor histidine kinase [Chitinophaga qingshengii]|uniref:Oxygen sensor histidine kinase NreB n=1 Tax=Chitinophaga qingshengii TaxID=1569794 RepID=A0ABR7TSV2_9BACT|nr:ATP-binding protein [Chitinophaga qingshengii]MBC9932682.1 hypothetical protein [Chitinophaga qingshengii]